MRKIAFICFDRFSILDLTGPMQIFSSATIKGKAQYDIHILSNGGGMISCSAGLTVQTKPLKDLKNFDSLIVVGGAGTLNACKDTKLIRYIRKQSPKVNRVISICTGSFLLAEIGLLDGKKATTHWSSLGRLARDNPTITPVPDAFYVRDGNVITSAGVTAGMDLTLSLVEEDMGHDVAIDIAKGLVMFYHRPGGQSQFSVHTRNQILKEDKFKILCEEITAHPEKDHSVPLLAEYMSMSARNFSRRFTEDIGISPGKYVEQARLEATKRLLENSVKTVEEIANGSGFNSEEVLRRVFQRHCGITPAQYRSRYAKLLI